MQQFKHIGSYGLILDNDKIVLIKKVGGPYDGKLDLIARHALHAYKLKFNHPFTHEEICLSSSLPDDMEKLIID